MAISAARRAARGSSIIVPTAYSTFIPRSRRTVSATSTTWSRMMRSSSSKPTSGIMISTSGASPLSALTVQAAFMMAATCMR